MSDEDEVCILVGGRVPATGELMLPDNLVGPCDTCGYPVQYRPHAPKPFILRCLPCTVDQITPGDVMTTTRQMLDDAHEVLRKKQH